MYKAKLVRRVMFVPVLLLFAGLSQAETRTDVLDTPALRSSLAVNSGIFDITQAGKRAIAVGVHGHILHSDDQGQSWQQGEVPVSTDLTAVQFVDDNFGWAVGHDSVILASQDGGKHWTKQFDGRQLSALLKQYYSQLLQQDPNNADYQQLLDDAERNAQNGTLGPLLDLHFFNRQLGYVVGAFNLILMTQDGGATWVPLMDKMANPSNYHLNAIAAVGEELYIVGEQGLLRKLHSHTNQVESLTPPYSSSFFGITAQDAQICLYGLRGHLFCRRDDNAQWQSLDTGSNASITSVALNGSLILVGNQTGKIFIREQGQPEATQTELAIQAPITALQLTGSQLIVAGLKGLQTLPLPAAVSPSEKSSMQ